MKNFKLSVNSTTQKPNKNEKFNKRVINYKYLFNIIIYSLN